MNKNPEWANLEMLVKRCNELGYDIIEEDIGNEGIDSYMYESGTMVLWGEAKVYVPEDVTVSCTFDGRIRLTSSSGIMVEGAYTGCETFNHVTLSIWKRERIDSSVLMR